LVKTHVRWRDLARHQHMEKHRFELIVLTEQQVLADLRTLDDWAYRNNCRAPSPEPTGHATWQLWFAGKLIVTPSADVARHIAAEVVREAKTMRKLGLRAD
jgi:hypothetical protein